MTVLLANTTATVRRRIEGALNAHGERTSAGLSARATALLPALVEQRSDGSWALALDPALWPVRQNDVVDDQRGRTFVIVTSDLLENPVEPLVNFISCEARNVTADGTEPVDPWFVARSDSTPSPVDPGSGNVIVGHGPPSADLTGTEGVWYLDIDTGTAYEYREVTP